MDTPDLYTLVDNQKAMREAITSLHQQLAALRSSVDRMLVEIAVAGSKRELQEIPDQDLKL